MPSMNWSHAEWGGLMWWLDLTETVPRWLETLKSPTGLYRMSASAFHEQSLDATLLAVDLQQMLHSGRDVTALRYVTSSQLEEYSGFWQEAFCDYDPASLDRMWEMSATSISCQAAGLYHPYATTCERWRPVHFYDQFLRPGAIACYMTEAMPWGTKPMGAGNMVDAAATMMRMNVAMGHYEYWHVITEMYQWLDEQQNGYHGFWGSHRAQGWDGVVQAGYHVLRGLHLQDGRRLYGPHRMLRTVRKCLAEASAPLDACHYMDCAVLLEHLANSYGPTPAAQKAARKIVDDIKPMRREDGGFSFSAEGAITNHNRYEVTPGEMESDLVGTVFYLQALRSALLVLGEEVPWGESATHGVRG